MPLSCDPAATFAYTLAQDVGDDGKPKPGAPTFHVRFLSLRELAILQDKLTAYNAAEKLADETRILLETAALVVARWDRLTGRDGIAIEAPDVQGLTVLSPTALYELAFLARREASASERALKKSKPPSP